MSELEYLEAENIELKQLRDLEQEMDKYYNIQEE